MLAIAGLFVLLRAASLGLRLLRLRRQIAATTGAAPALQRAVEQAAHALGATVPSVRVSGPGGEALLAGLRKPVLILPADLAQAPEAATTRAVCAHELAHLKRGDHRALWIEKALLVVAAINPLLRFIRDHRAAAREEACDALALAGAPAEQRRLYARALLDAVQTAGFQRTTPALTFTSARRTFVMNRLKAVLAPAAPAGPGSRRLTVGLAALIAGVVGAGSFAVAAQRQPVLVPTPLEVADRSQPVSALTGTPSLTETSAARGIARAVQVPVQAPVVVPQPIRTEPSAPAVGDSPADISRVTWAQYPAPMFPTVAASNGVSEGQVNLVCTVEADGRASGCSVLEETPAGQGFGDAALAAMETARFSPSTLATATPGQRARFTIRFRVAE